MLDEKLARSRLTISSPFLPPRRGALFLFKRSVVPVFDPFGTDIVTSPVGVGTRIYSPISLRSVGNPTRIATWQA